MNHWATYDSLSIAIKLQDNLGDVSIDEIQMFAYLSCLMSLYEGNGVSDWGYGFIKSEIGSPYNCEIPHSVSTLTLGQYLETTDKRYFVVTTKSVDRFKTLSEFEIYKKREKIISETTNCIKFIPFGEVRNAIQFEPTLQYARKIHNRQTLLDPEGASFQILHDQFEYLRLGLKKQYTSLVIPTLVWMSANIKRQLG